MTFSSTHAQVTNTRQQICTSPFHTIRGTRQKKIGREGAGSNGKIVCLMLVNCRSLKLNYLQTKTEEAVCRKTRVCVAQILRKWPKIHTQNDGSILMKFSTGNLCFKRIIIIGQFIFLIIIIRQLNGNILNNIFK